MKITKTIFSAICIVVIGTTSLKAQQGVSASGGEAYGPGGTASYTVGLADYATAVGPGGTITQGYQQPIEILIINGIDQTNIELKCAVYPNPTTDYVVLSVLAPGNDAMSFMLYDMQGRILSSKKLEGSETKISLLELADAFYYLKVFTNEKEVKTFKIIKNK